MTKDPVIDFMLVSLPLGLPSCGYRYSQSGKMIAIGAKKVEDP